MFSFLNQIMMCFSNSLLSLSYKRCIQKLHSRIILCTLYCTVQYSVAEPVPEPILQEPEPVLEKSGGSVLKGTDVVCTKVWESEGKKCLPCY